PKVVSRAVQAALAKLPALPEWLDPAFQRVQALPPWREALLAAHKPDSAADLLPTTPARRRLAYDELLANQLAVALVRAQQRRLPGRRTAGDGRLRAKALAALPFALTGSQRQAGAEIAADMESEQRML